MPPRAADRKARKRFGAWKLGCGLVALVPLLVVLVVGVRTCVPLQSAGEARVQLLERFGAPESFVPAADGAIPAARMSAFLEVRHALREACDRFRTMQGSMNQVDELGERHDATGKEIATTTGGFAKVAGSITPLVGEFFERRNRALLEAEMGFGDYFYIFTLSYREALRDDSAPRGIFTANGRISPEVGSALRAMLARQLGLLDPGEAPDLRATLEREVRMLEREPSRVPFREALPLSVADSLAPYRQRLDQLFCRSTAEIEMDLYAGRALKDALY